MAFAGLVQTIKKFGSITEATGLREKRRRFFEKLRGRRVPIDLQGQEVVSQTAMVTANLTEDPPGPAIGERLKYLERQTKQLQDRQARLQSKIDKVYRELNRKVDLESQEREAADQKLEASLKDEAVGGFFLEATGVLWVFIGILLSSLPNQMSL